MWYWCTQNPHLLQVNQVIVIQCVILMYTEPPSSSGRPSHSYTVCGTNVQNFPSSSGRPCHGYWLVGILIYWPLTFVLTSLHEYWHTLFQEGVATALGVPMNKVKVRSRRLGKLELRCASGCCRFQLMPFCNYACLWLKHKVWVKRGCLKLELNVYVCCSLLNCCTPSCVVICRTHVEEWNVWSHDDTAHT